MEKEKDISFSHPGTVIHLLGPAAWRGNNNGLCLSSYFPGTIRAAPINHDNLIGPDWGKGLDR